MLEKGLTLRGLELFEAIARTGSIAGAAEQTGMSLPAISQQMTNLEATLGQALIDRTRRPMRLTPAGRVFLARVESALRQIRQAQAEVATMDLAHLSDLRLGTIDDFDAEVTPQLVTALAKNLANCRFRLTTGPSHDIMRKLTEGALDIVICAAAQDRPAHLTEAPLLRDPYVLAVPRGFSLTQGDEIKSLSNLPLLRYDRDQFMGRQIGAQLSRLRVELPNRFELDSNQSILGLVASGAGWSITTPVAYLRARQFMGQVDIHPLPFPAFSRTISLFWQSEQMDRVAEDLARRLRVLLQTLIVDPGHRMIPWLGDGFAVKKG